MTLRPRRGRKGPLMILNRARVFNYATAHRLPAIYENDLAHALARDAELVGELLERDRFFGEPARLEDAPLPLVERGERRGEGLAAGVEPLAPGAGRVAGRTLLAPPDPPLARASALRRCGVRRGDAP